MPDVGRAARLRVERQLAVARHGEELLERKQRIVQAEHERLLALSDNLRDDWERAAATASTWAARAAALDGWPAIEAASPADPATVRVDVGDVMGVELPEDGTVDIPARPLAPGSSCLVNAATTADAALRAAIDHAVARRATITVHAELVATRTRRRAVEHRWVPQLEERLARIRHGLEELDREENLRVRWAMGTRTERGRRSRAGGQA